MRNVILYLSLTAGLLVAGLLVMWAAGLFAGLEGLSGHGVAALVITCVGLVLVYVVPMALAVHSNRSGRDEDVHESLPEPFYDPDHRRRSVPPDRR